jgi:hypothetical protein
MNIRSLLPILILAVFIPAIVRADPANSDRDPVTPPELVDGKAPKTEKVTYLGVTAKPVDDTLRAQLNLPDGVGLTVMTVDHKGPAADIQPNDVLQKLDDQLLIDAHQLVTLIHLHKAGDKVTLTVIRSAKPMVVTIQLGEKARIVRPDNDADHTADDSGDKTSDAQGAGGGVNPFDVTLPGVDTSVLMSFKDDAFSATVHTDKDGHKKLTVKDASNKIVADGLVDTAEQWQKFSPEIRIHLEVLHKMLIEQSK